VVPVTEPILPQDASLRDAIALIERTRRVIVAVVDGDGKLLGILSDGDIRRGILAGVGLESPATSAMTRDPICGSSQARPDELFDLMMRRGIAAVPVVDAQGRFVRVALLSDLDETANLGGEGFAAAVIMAGGEGRRLRPLTADRPKPMIDIGGVPLLERQIRAMVACGLRRIYISTNYLGHIIENHFADGSEFGAEIRYLREPTKLGTAGALSLLPDLPEGPMLVINGDVLTTSDFGKLLAFHRETKADITIAAMIYRVHIPFGVLQVDGHRVAGIEEKPSQGFLCNAGIYVFSPEAVRSVPAGVQVDMPSVIEKMIARKAAVSVFPIHEFWTDIGTPNDLELAMAEFGEKAHS
jgi:dTDP-glucose pyrophosphorylase